MNFLIVPLLIVVMLSCANQPAATAEPRPPHVGRNPAISPAAWERVGHACVAVGEKVYVIGGVDNSGPHRAIARVDCYDTRRREWSVAAPLPTPRVFAGVAVVEGKIHVVGGISDEDFKNKRDSAMHECYDPATDKWSTLAVLPTARSRLAAAGAGGKFCAIGGLVNTSGVYADSAAVEVYDPKSDAWSRGPDMPTARHALAAAVIDNRVYVLGGFSLKETLEPLSRCEVLDVGALEWSKGPEMTAVRSWFGVVVVDGCLVAIGGAEHPERLCAPFEKWATIDVPDIDDRRFAAAAVGDEVLVMGGEAGGEWLRVVKTR